MPRVRRPSGDAQQRQDRRQQVQAEARKDFAPKQRRARCRAMDQKRPLVPALLRQDLQQAQCQSNQRRRDCENQVHAVPKVIQLQKRRLPGRHLVQEAKHSVGKAERERQQGQDAPFQVLAALFPKHRFEGGGIHRTSSFSSSTPSKKYELAPRRLK